MRPQFSLIIFTTLIGMAQGLLFFIALFQLSDKTLSNPFLGSLALPVGITLLVLGLITSFFHLGHPERAWRAAQMWKTSWLSREVIVMPIFMAITALAWYSVIKSQQFSIIWLALIVFSTLLWICTAQIYQCIRFLQEWAHPLTLINFVSLGLTSGWLLLGCLVVISSGDINVPSLKLLCYVGALLLLISLTIKLTIWKRNLGLRPKSTLNTAIGVQQGSVRQISMGLMGGSFNTREFFHHQTDLTLRNLRLIIFLLAYAVPILLLVYILNTNSDGLIPITLLIHYAGLLCERWMFFAEANHPQNLYYQRIS